MSENAEKAGAARWLASQIGPGLSDPRAAELWAQLEERLEDCRSAGSRQLELTLWKREIQARLAPRREAA